MFFGTPCSIKLIEKLSRRHLINSSDVFVIKDFTVGLLVVRRFAPIFYFNCEHFLSVYIVKQNLKKVDELKKVKFSLRQIFEILIIYKSSLGTCKVPRKIWAWSVQPFWLFFGYKRTNRQTSKVHIDIWMTDLNNFGDFFWRLTKLFLYTRRLTL